MPSRHPLTVRLDGGTDPFAAMARATRMPMIVTDPRLPDNPVVFVNDSFCRLSGYKREEVLGRNCRFLQGPETDPDTVERIRAAVAAAEAVEIDIRNHRKDGRPFWNRLLLAPVRDAAGQLAYFFASQMDVTLERERLAGLETHNAALLAELAGRLRAQEQSEARIARILNTVPAGIVELDADGHVAYANPAAERVLGAAPGGLVGRHYDDSAWDAAAPDGEPVLSEQMPVAQALRGEAMTDFEQAVTTVDGRRVVVLVDAVPVRSPPGAGPSSGQVEGALVAFQDITARQQTVQALRKSEERLLALVKASSDALYCMNPDWTEMRHLSGGGFLSDTGSSNRAWLAEYIHPDDQEHVTAAIQEAVQTRGVFELEHRVRRANGTVGWTNSRAVPLLNADGSIREWFGVASDVTARKKAEAALRCANEALEARVAERTAELSEAVNALYAAAEARAQVEEALRQSQKMEAVGQLTGGLAHDFNNLLAGISGSLELLQTRVAQGRINDLERYITAAQGASKRAAALTHRLLAFTRRQTLDPKPTNVNRLVTGMEELIRRTVGPQVTVEIVGAGGLWPVLVDPNQIENALLNLCINARDAMPGGGRLTIETNNKWLDVRAARERDLPPGQYVSLSVSDTGTGMTPEVARRAFDPFFTTKPIGMGTGLGLSMIYGFVQQSGGQARIYSEPSQGAMVCLYLPRHNGEAASEDAEAELAGAPRAGQGETVLVVDDEPTVRMLVTEVLEDLGYTAVEAADGPAGLKVLRSDVRIDLLVSDVGLPGGMNGRQMADAGRAVRPDLKVLFITGYAENAVVGNGHLDPGMHVLTKPFAMEALASRIKELIAGSQAKCAG